MESYSINTKKTKINRKSSKQSSHNNSLLDFFEFENDHENDNENEHKNVKVNKLKFNKDLSFQEIFEKMNPGKVLKDKQFEILDSVINKKKDTVGILATGYGKSICYQLPFLYYKMKKNIIVISPLISLMEDQYEKLKSLDIPVFVFHSGIKTKERDAVKDELINSTEGKILYLTPEYLQKCEFFIKDLADNDKLGLIAIDEAHCISTWGSDFRTDYQALHYFRDWVPEIPILALTATATKFVEEDMIIRLQLDDPLIVRSSFNRPNLYLSCEKKPKNITYIYNVLNKHNNTSIIIYCKTKQMAEKVNEQLTEDGYSSDVYHAGLHNDLRKEIQYKFSSGETKIIVATIAFGMGIDQNVRLVIHWGCPSDIESYYQEIGRAGRDGSPSECYLYFDSSDFKLTRFFIEKLKNENSRKFKENQLIYMERLCYIDSCRTQYVLDKFDEKIDKCDNCDNCKKYVNKVNTTTKNIMYPIYILVKTILLSRCNLGSNKIVLILRGSKNKQITNMLNYQTYNMCKNISEDNIKLLLKLLIFNNLLRDKTVVGGFGTVIDATPEIIKWFNLIEKDIRYNKITSLDYDSLKYIVEAEDKLLKLNITSSFNKLNEIKFETKMDVLISEFDLDEY